jgi:DNA-binding response OmpR family regulator
MDSMRNGFRLLVVEDDAELCESLADVLRLSGYEVETAQDGESALARLRLDPPPDAILLDLVLPRMSAEELLDAAPWPRPPVVLMTGLVQPHRRPPGRDVLMKPFGLEQLLGRVARACDHARSAYESDAST